jgi:hypothetical protein
MGTRDERVCHTKLPAFIPRPVANGRLTADVEVNNNQTHHDATSFKEQPNRPRGTATVRSFAGSSFER